VIDCCPCSNLKSDEAVSPVFFENAAYGIPARCFLRNAANFLSSSVGAEGTQAI
jgi:hypothetical protein